MLLLKTIGIDVSIKKGRDLSASPFLFFCGTFLFVPRCLSGDAVSGFSDSSFFRPLLLPKLGVSVLLALHVEILFVFLYIKVGQDFAIPRSLVCIDDEMDFPRR